MGLEGAMKEPTTQVYGVIVIFDMKGLSLSQVMQFTPSYAKMVIEWIQVSFILILIRYGDDRSYRPHIEYE